MYSWGAPTSPRASHSPARSAPRNNSLPKLHVFTNFREHRPRRKGPPTAKHCPRDYTYLRTAGCIDRAQAPRNHRQADVQPRFSRILGRHGRLCGRNHSGFRVRPSQPRNERGGQRASESKAAPPRHHRSLANARILPLGHLIPEHAAQARGGRGLGRYRPPRGSEGERHHRPPHPRGHRICWFQETRDDRRDGSRICRTRACGGHARPRDDAAVKLLTMNIRPAIEADRATILALIRMFPDQLAQDHLPDMAEFFVAEDEKGIFGCCALEVYSPKIAEVRYLAVKEEYRGKGVARTLVEACVERAQEKGIRQVLAITGALDFFDKLGFKAFQSEKYALFRTFD